MFGILVFCGFEGAAALGEETENPTRNVGLAVTLSVAFTTIYISVGMYAMVVAMGLSDAADITSRSTLLRMCLHDILARRGLPS